MTTPEQRKSADRLQRHIERHQLVSGMNATKWGELFRLLESVQHPLSFRTKYVRETEPSHWHGDLYFALGGTHSIEWLELDAKISIPRGVLLPPSIEDHTHALRSTLERAKIRYTIEDGVVRIWGYLRPGAPPGGRSEAS